MLNKTNSKELQSTITIIVSLILIAMPVVYILQYFGIVETERIALGEVVLVCGAAILVMFDIMFIFQKENRFLTLFDFFILLFIISVVISTLFAENPELAFAGNDMTSEGTFVMIAYMVILFSVYIVENEENKRIIYYSLILFGLIQVVFGIMQAVLKLDFCRVEASSEFMDLGRAMGTLTNPNPYGSVMALLAGMEYGKTYVSKNKKKKICHGGLALMFTYAVLLSGTRGAWVGLAFGAFVGSLIAIAKGKKDGNVSIALRNLGIVVIAVVISVGAFLIFSAETVNEVHNRTQADLNAKQIGEERLIIWKGTFERCVIEHPIIGAGVSNICVLITAQLGIPTDDSAEMEYSSELAVDAHNRYLNILCTQGGFGLMIYLCIIIATICFVFFVMKIQFDDVYPLLVAFLVYLMSDMFTISSVYMVPIFMVIIGLINDRTKMKKIIGK